MTSSKFNPRLIPCLRTLSCFVLTMLVILSAPPAYGQSTKIDVLRIGTSGKLTGTSGPREKAGLDTLHTFITEETGLNNEILRQRDWQELADKMAKGDLHVGVMQGYEFAWAVEKYPKLKPLVITVNVYRYPVAYLVISRDNTAKDFADLKGQSLAIPETGQWFLRLFLERQGAVDGKKLEDYFSTITTPGNVEDALDSLVDGKVQAVVVDRSALEAYKQRKPGRFNRLKPLTHSQPFPPTVIAYSDSVLDQTTLNLFQNGLLNAKKKERGATLLTLFRLTNFETIPDDFETILAESRKSYPLLPPAPKP